MSALKENQDMTADNEISLARKKYFSQDIYEADQEIGGLLTELAEDREKHLMMVASAGIASMAALTAQSTTANNDYAEGTYNYDKGVFGRFYEGLDVINQIEEIAMRRTAAAFGVDFDKGFVNVQPHSGCPANAAVYLGLMADGDVLLGMSLDAGGHLTHGAAPTASAKHYKAVQYGLKNDGSGLIDYDQIEALALEHNPRVIVAGFSAYSRIVEWKRFAEIADKVAEKHGRRPFVMADIAHVAGLIAGGAYPSPVNDVDVVTFTTHKALSGPRGAAIIAKDRNIDVDGVPLHKKLNSAVFPGSQGGPHIHAIAGIAYTMGYAQTEEFKEIAARTVDNARVLAATLKETGLDIFSGGTDNHLMLVDLRPKGLKGNAAARSLARAGIIANKNAIPHDDEKPFVTSGIRFGTQVLTLRGMGAEDMKIIGGLIDEVLGSLAALPEDERILKGVNAGSNSEIEDSVRAKVEALTAKYPTYEAGRE
jgi:glycine hydroxymethyltransferase